MRFSFSFLIMAMGSLASKREDSSSVTHSLNRSPSSSLTAHSHLDVDAAPSLTRRAKPPEQPNFVPNSIEVYNAAMKVHHRNVVKTQALLDSARDRLMLMDPRSREAATIRSNAMREYRKVSMAVHNSISGLTGPARKLAEQNLGLIFDPILEEPK